MSSTGIRTHSPPSSYLGFLSAHWDVSPGSLSSPGQDGDHYLRPQREAENTSLGSEALGPGPGHCVYQMDDTGEPLHLLEPQFPPL